MKNKKIKSSNLSQPSIKTQPSKAQKIYFLPKRKFASPNLFHLNQQKQPNSVSLFVNLPVYEDYKHIDLNKTTLYQQRINHQKPKQLNQATQLHHKQTSQISTSESKGRKAEIQRISTTDSKGWKAEIEEYMELKQKTTQKHQDQYDGYPLMRLSKKNELLRKIKTNQKFAGKPEVVAKLQTEQMFDEKPLMSSKTNPLPKLSRYAAQLTSKGLRQFENSSSLVQNEMNREFRFRKVIQNANKNQKVLINFIGNYFRQKFCPERRYSHQIPKRQYKEDIIKLQIKNILDPSRNQSILSTTLYNS